MGCGHILTASNEVTNVQAIISESIRGVKQDLRGKQIFLVSKALEKHYLFYKLGKGQRMKLISSMQKIFIPDGGIIFKQDDQPDYIYFICLGCVKIQIKQQKNVTKQILFKVGDIVGDLDLINNSPRQGSAYGQENCQLITLKKQNFHRIMKEIVLANSQIVRRYIEKSLVFRKLTQTQKISISNSMYDTKFIKNTIIYDIGDTANCFYLIKSGEVQVTKQKIATLILREGDIFGENCLRKRSTRRGQAKALTNVNCLVITNSKLSLCVEPNDIDTIFRDCTLRWTLRMSQMFSLKSSELIEEIMAKGSTYQVHDYSQIITAGQIIEKMIICTEGSLTVEDIFGSKNKSQEQFNAGSIFGEDYNKITKATISLKTQGKGFYFQISHTILKQILNQKSIVPSKIQLLCPVIDLKNYCIVGKRESSQLFTAFNVCQCWRNDQKFTLYAYRKSQIQLENKQNQLINEMKLNRFLKDYSTIIHLQKTFKDQQYIYLFYDYHPNITLQDFMRKIASPNTIFIRFIIEGIIQCIENLHKEKIILRSLEPQNISFNMLGFPSLIYLMNSKKVDKISSKTATIIGNPHYMAPQMHRGVGYSFPVDFWALGIVIYQMIMGYVPFGQNEEDPYEIFVEVQTRQLKFPNSFKNNALKLLITALLNKKSQKRPSLTNLRAFQYFTEVTSSSNKRQLKCPIQILEQICQQDVEKSQQLINLETYFDKENLNTSGYFVKDAQWDNFF